MNNGNQTPKEQKTIHNGFVSYYGKLFLWVLSAFSIIFIIFLCFANREFKHSQERIKQSYAEHLQKADSLYWDMVIYNKKYTSCIGDASNTIITDSLIRLTLGTKQKLSLEQYENLAKIISCHFAKVEQLHERYDNKILHDSLLLITERQVLEGQIKTMLDLHLKKVEHEYSNITLWAAVLTILFLVFSFYSIFKMDGLVHQGHEGVREIKHLNKEGETAIQEIRDKRDALISSSEEKINNIKEKATLDYSTFVSAQQKILKDTLVDVNQKIDEIKKTSNQAIIDVTTTKQGIENMREESIKLLNEKLSTIEKNYDNALRSKVEELNSYSDRLQIIISNLEQRMKNMNQKEDEK